MLKINENVESAILFDDLVEYGKENDANIVNGVPWSFEYDGCSITHENDGCYIVLVDDETFRFTPSDVLVKYKNGKRFVCTVDWFALNLLRIVMKESED